MSRTNLLWNILFELLPLTVDDYIVFLRNYETDRCTINVLLEAPIKVLLVGKNKF